jgi:hypothetical protein
MPTYSAEWDQGDYRANNDTRKRMGFGGVENGGQRFSERSQGLGFDAQKRGAYQSDFTQSNQARGHQEGGLGLLQGAAAGTAPSQAAIEARLAGERARAGNVSMAGSVKGGPGARVAAMRAAMAGNAGAGQQIAAQASAARAGEMAQARGQYAQAAAATRGLDLEAQKVQQQNELFQRGANDAQQRFFEQQATGIQTQDQNNQLQQQQLASNNWSQGRAATMADESFGFSKDMTWAKAGAGAAQGGLGAAAGAIGGGSPDPNATSDAAAKNLVPMGSLASLSNPSFDRLSGGGMDVLGSLKAHSNFATQYQRDPSGGMMRSDMVSKEPRNIMYSPGEIKNAESFVNQQRKAGAYAQPDMTPIPAPTQQAPAYEPAPWLTQEMSRDDGIRYGYFNEHDDAKPIQSAAEADYAKHFDIDAAKADAAKADNRKEAAKIQAGFAKDKPGGGLALGSLAGILGGFSGAPTMRSDMTSKNEVMYSDDKTKLAAAFEAGKVAALAPKDGKPVIGGKVTDAIKSATGKDAQKLHDVAQNAAVGSTPVTAPLAALGPAQDAAAKAIHDAQRGKPDPTARRDAEDAAIDVGYAAAAGPVFGNIATRIARSDEKAKNVIDLDETSMRDGSSDPRTNSFDKTFRRDTKADQRAVKKRVQDNAAKEADKMIASMQAGMDKGPSARSEDLQDDAPDLSKAADRAKGAGAIPDAAMYSAMKSMRPSLYSYKPPFTPPEQKVGEVQAGPMANPMAKDPVAGTAIEREPSTGLLAIDKDKALKLTMGSLAVLAEDLEAMKRKLGGGKRKG